MGENRLFALMNRIMLWKILDTSNFATPVIMKTCDNQVLKSKKGEKFAPQILQLGLECVRIL